MRRLKTLFQLRWVIFLFSVISVAAGSSGVGLNGGAGPVYAQELESKKIVPFVPTPQDVVEKMLQMAGVKKGDVVFDLGSGDGRIVITAAKKYGVRAVGFEIDPDLIKQSRENIRKAGVEKLAEIREQDIRTVDLSQATIVTMYLLPEVNLMIRPNLWRQLKPGSRVVSHDFDMRDWKPVKTEEIKESESGWGHTLYLWIIEKGDQNRR